MCLLVLFEKKQKGFETVAEWKEKDKANCENNNNRRTDLTRKYNKHTNQQQQQQQQQTTKRQRNEELGAAQVCACLGAISALSLSRSYLS